LICIAVVSLILKTAGALPVSAGFVGCFYLDDLSVFGFQVQTKVDVPACKTFCNDQGLGLAVISSWAGSGFMKTCSCSTTLPDPDYAISLNVTCAEDPKPGTALMYYTLPSATGVCKLESVLFNKENFEVVYLEENVAFNKKVPTAVSLNINKDAKGTRMHMKGDNILYGMYQCDVFMSPESGVVSAFYLRNDYKQETEDFSEIDYEFINGWPAENGTIWLNSLTNGSSNGEHPKRPAVYRSQLNTPLMSSSGWNTYTIDWQPAYLSWNMNNNILQNIKVGTVYNIWNGKAKRMEDKLLTTTPNKACHLTFSHWSCNEQSCEDGKGNQFGGPLYKNSTFPMQTHFRNLRRLTCAK